MPLVPLCTYFKVRFYMPPPPPPLLGGPAIWTDSLEGNGISSPFLFLEGSLQSSYQILLVRVYNTESVYNERTASTSDRQCVQTADRISFGVRKDWFSHAISDQRIA